MDDPIIQAKSYRILINEACYNAWNAKVIPDTQIKIHKVLMSRQNIASRPFFEEIYAIYVIIFKKNELLALLNNRLQKRADPGDKSQRPTIEK